MAKKKLTIAGRLRQLLKSTEGELKDLTDVNEVLSKRVNNLETQLSEARRRTIAMADGSELNFLPLYIEELETKFDRVEVESLRGDRASVLTGVRAVIHARGDLQFNPRPTGVKADGTRVGV